MKKLFIWTNTTNIQNTPDYSSATAIMLVTFWTQPNFWIISDFSNSFNNKLKNLWTSKCSKANTLTQQIHSIHLKNTLSKNVTRLLACVLFSLGSIVKYWIYVIYGIGVLQPSKISKIEYFAKIVHD